jgi:signal peptidase I
MTTTDPDDVSEPEHTPPVEAQVSPPPVGAQVSPPPGEADEPGGSDAPAPEVTGPSESPADAPAPVARGTASLPILALPPVRGRASVPAPAQSTVDGPITGQVVGRASVPVPASVDLVIPGTLSIDDESLHYVEGRPGQELAEDLAEQRLIELPTAKETTRAQDNKRRVMPLWQELPLLVIVSFCVAVLVRSFLVQAFEIPSGSMEDTLQISDRVLVNKIVYETRPPHRGDVVVFRGTERWAPENVDEAPGGMLDRIGDTLGDLVGVSRPGEKDFIKRVIGVPGDRIYCCDEGRVVVNGVPIDEPYLASNNAIDLLPTPGICGPRQFAEVVVPPGELFVMGDNRGVSQDSRCQGTVPIDNVVGRAFFLVWPPSHWGGVGTSEDTFAHVPSAVAAPSRVVTPAPADPVAAALALATLTVPFVHRRTGSRPWDRDRRVRHPRPGAARTLRR